MSNCTHFLDILMKVVNLHEIHGILHMSIKEKVAREYKFGVIYQALILWRYTIYSPCFKPNEMKLPLQRTRIIR